MPRLDALPQELVERVIKHCRAEFDSDKNNEDRGSDNDVPDSDIGDDSDSGIDEDMDDDDDDDDTHDSATTDDLWLQQFRYNVDNVIRRDYCMDTMMKLRQTCRDMQSKTRRLLVNGSHGSITLWLDTPRLDRLLELLANPNKSADLAATIKKCHIKCIDADHARQQAKKMLLRTDMETGVMMEEAALLRRVFECCSALDTIVFMAFGEQHQTSYREIQEYDVTVESHRFLDFSPSFNTVLSALTETNTRPKTVVMNSGYTRRRESVIAREFERYSVAAGIMDFEYLRQHIPCLDRLEELMISLIADDETAERQAGRSLVYALNRMPVLTSLQLYLGDDTYAGVALDEVVISSNMGALKKLSLHSGCCDVADMKACLLRHKETLTRLSLNGVLLCYRNDSSLVPGFRQLLQVLQTEMSLEYFLASCITDGSTHRDLSGRQLEFPNVVTNRNGNVVLDGAEHVQSNLDVMRTTVRYE